jgi:hypothetical protein
MRLVEPQAADAEKLRREMKDAVRSLEDVQING